MMFFFSIVRRIQPSVYRLGMAHFWCWFLPYHGEINTLCNIEKNLTCLLQRRAWIPFFDNMDFMIFCKSLRFCNTSDVSFFSVSPLSVFDQWLNEQPRVNCLEDSLLLWGSICSSGLLMKTQLILFLNKCDLLHKKLKQGTKVARYIPSYGDRPNNLQSVIACGLNTSCSLRWLTSLTKISETSTEGSWGEIHQRLVCLIFMPPVLLCVSFPGARSWWSCLTCALFLDRTPL